MKTSTEIRSAFLDFFKQRGHLIVPSAPVIPQGDPTLLFTNAGMNQFKPYFLGQQKPEATRIADTQKCIRVSGKHNDLEEVGPSNYHHTFFEMLGNWSFGDYFKRDAISWAWELMTQVYKLPKDKLYATIYETDDEAGELWKSVTDIDPTHVLKFGKKDNFWSMGDTGPCGPCSEIHIDRGPQFDSDPKAFVNSGSPRYLELWNLVFIQYDAQPDGKLVPLPAQHVDTGAGLERITNVLSGVTSNYDTDLFQPIIQAVAELSGHPYTALPPSIPHRVIADHLRCLTFAITDGAMPGNEGRGYVLRRILRRAARFGRKLELHEPFLHKLVPVLVDTMGEQFPELKERHVHVARVLHAEEEHFGKTLDRGLTIFGGVVSEVRKRGASEIPGEEVFKLYDSFGFPLDLTQLMAREEGLSVDQAGFDSAMQQQKDTARAAGKFKAGKQHGMAVDGTLPTRFVGYDSLDAESHQIIVGAAAEVGRSASYVATEVTPFYVESGGQVSDVGSIELVTADGDDHKYHVTGTTKIGDTIVHSIDAGSAGLFEGRIERAILRVSPQHRIPTQYNHTATHLLHAALRKTLGEHVHQAGSYVGPDYLRFDYTHFEKPSADELAQIELLVNESIRGNFPVTPKIMPIKEAQALGAMALFGEKYGDEVRMIEIADSDMVISRELCGGCHVKRTGDIGVFVIRAETSAAAGIRRIDALTGEAAYRYLIERRNKVDEFTLELGSEGSDPLDKLKKFLDEKKRLQKELDHLRGQSAVAAMKALTAQAVSINSSRLVAAEVSAPNLDIMKEMGDALRDALGSGVGVLAGAVDGKPQMVVVVTPDLVKRGVDAVAIVKELGKRLQGGGGGKPHLATAGGKHLDGIKTAIVDAESVVKSFVK
ncbi:alanine--tRNA ligase [candidate division KSB1 bacterium]|nr:alanine--tRNA ligase [candidate division KSB1 bacterium]